MEKKLNSAAQVRRTFKAGRPPKADQDLEEWQTAIGCLIGAAEGRDFMMHARIGVLRALNCHVERTFIDRKEMHWGRRILKRDQT